MKDLTVTTTPNVEAADRFARYRFHRNGGGTFENFDFTRFYHDGSISNGAALFAKIVSPKINTGGKSQAVGTMLPRADLILPPTAPGDLYDIATFLARIDALPLLKQDLGIGIKITLSDREPAHAGWEVVRAWSHAYFAMHHSLASIAILHRPGLAGSQNLPHVHLYVPIRCVTADGFGGAVQGLACDDGHRSAWASWRKFRAEFPIVGG